MLVFKNQHSARKTEGKPLPCIPPKGVRLEPTHPPEETNLYEKKSVIYHLVIYDDEMQKLLKFVAGKKYSHILFLPCVATKTASKPKTFFRLEITC